MNFPWETEPRCPKCGAAADERFDCCEVHGVAADLLGIPAFLRRDANNRAPFMDVVAAPPQPAPCTEPPRMPWSTD